MRLLLLLLIALLAAPGVARAAGLGAAPPLLWRGSTASPDPLSGSDAADPLYAICGAPEAGLRAVAARNAARIVRGEPSFASDELAFTMRSAGMPYVWPRAWSTRGKGLDATKVGDELGKFVTRSRAIGVRRCGIARLQAADGGTVISVVTVDALADLDRVPTLARVGEWITIRATMRVKASDAKVVLLGPRGPPRTVLASLSDDEVRATFSVDQPGEWLVQVLATSTTGPRPVLEAYILAGTSPPLRFAESPAPGEDAASLAVNDSEAMRSMLNAARVSEGLKPLAGDPVLDKLAIAHSVRMRDQRAIGHDLGDGDLPERLAVAGIIFRSRGENLAAAATTVRAHRALWLSPSHRSNLLDARFTRLGLGVARSDDGRVWVTELFID